MGLVPALFEAVHGIQPVFQGSSRKQHGHTLLPGCVAQLFLLFFGQEIGNVFLEIQAQKTDGTQGEHHEQNGGRYPFVGREIIVYSKNQILHR